MKKIILALLLTTAIHAEPLSDTLAKIYPSDKPLIRHLWTRVADSGAILRGTEAVEISADGNLVASCSKFGYDVMVWRAADGSLLWHSQSPAELEIVYFSPDNQYLASGGEDYYVRIWEVATGELLHELKHDHGLDGLCWSHDGNILASGSEGGDLYLWNTETWTLKDRVNAGTVINSVQFTSDDQQILTGGNEKHPDFPASNKGMRLGTVKVWNTADLSLAENYPGHTKSVKSARLSTDESLIISGSFDNTIKIWDRTTRKIKHSMAMPGNVEIVTFSPCGHFIYVGGQYHGIWVYSTQTYEKVLEIESSPVEYIDFTKNGRLMATAQEKSGVISLYTFEHKQGLSGQFINSLLSNPDLN